MIRLATEVDLDPIMNIVKQSVRIMNEQGNKQWDATYPLHTHYLKDITNGELYVYEENNAILGAACISETEHSEYPTINWSLPDKAITMKRVVVNPMSRGKGVASMLYSFAEELTKRNNLHYIKTDTFSKNQSAKKLFHKMHYQFVQEKYVENKDDSLLYFEKVLTYS